MTRLDVRCRVKHLLHTRATLRTFVYDYHDIPGLHCTAEDTLYGSLLGVKDLCPSTETPDTLINTGCLHHTTVLGNVSEQNSKTAILGVSILERAYTTIGPVSVKRVICTVLRTHAIAENIRRGCAVYSLGLIANRNTCN